MPRTERIGARIAFNFDFDGQQSETFTSWGNAVKALRTARARTDEKLAKLKVDPNFTPVGRKSSLIDYMRSESGGTSRIIARAMTGIAEIKAKMEATQAQMRENSAPDPTDAAGAILRMDTRRWLRDMPDKERNALLLGPELDPMIAAAIVEAPASMSGVSDRRRETLVERASLAAHPKEAHRLANMALALTSLQSHLAATVHHLQETSGVTPLELEEQLEQPGLAAAIAEEVALPVEEAA